jgi:hypothetical protein
MLMLPLQMFKRPAAFKKLAASRGLQLSRGQRHPHQSPNLRLNHPSLCFSIAAIRDTVAVI